MNKENNGDPSTDGQLKMLIKWKHQLESERKDIYEKKDDVDSTLNHVNKLIKTLGVEPCNLEKN